MNEQKLQQTINELKCLRDSHVKSIQVLKTYKKGPFVREVQQQMTGFITGLDISIRLVEKLQQSNLEHSQQELGVCIDDGCGTNSLAKESVERRAGA